MEEGQDPPWNLPKCYPEQPRTAGQRRQKETQKLPEQMGQPGSEGAEMAVIIIISQIPLERSLSPKLVQIPSVSGISQLLWTVEGQSL